MVIYNFNPEASGIVLFANFDGEEIKTIKMLLDTGATYTTIPWHVAESLGYKPSDSDNWATITTADGVLTVPLFVVNSIEVLGHKIENVTVMIHDLPEISRVDGLLGLSYLRNFDLIIKFKEGILDLEKN